jgi:flagellar motility protein MotE (MotC chaperone)
MSRRKRRIVRVGRGTLSLIACLLIGSALIRAVSGAGEAWAKAEEHFQPEAPIPALEAMSAPDACDPEADMQAVLVALEAREKRLDQREAEVRDRVQALAIADQEIAERLQELQRAEAALSRTLAVADQAAERDIGTLVAVYENMKPKDAAPLFEEMDPNFAAGFLSRMKPEAAAGIMAGLSPNVGYTISVVLAGRNAEAPKE